MCDWLGIWSAAGRRLIGFKLDSLPHSHAAGIDVIWWHYVWKLFPPVVLEDWSGYVISSHDHVSTYPSVSQTMLVKGLAKLVSVVCQYVAWNSGV